MSNNTIICSFSVTRGIIFILGIFTAMFFFTYMDSIQLNKRLVKTECTI